MRFWSKNPIMKLRASLNTWAYWLGIGLLFVVGIGSYLNMAALTETIAARGQLRKSLNAVQEAFATILDAETGQRGYLLTGSDSYLDPYRAATKAIGERMDRIESLSTIMPDQRSNIEALQDLTAIKLAELSETVDLMKTHGAEAALKVVRTDRGRATMKKIRGLVAEIRESIEERILRNDRQMAALSVRTTVWGILANVSAAVLFSLVFFVLRRELRRRKRLEEQAQDLARSAEAMRLQSLAQSEAEIETLGQQARDLADYVESLRKMSPSQSDQEIQVVEEKARDLARSVEISRKMALKHSDRQVDALVKRARALAPFGEPGGRESLGQSNGDSASREKRARQLAAFSDAPPESIRAQSPYDMRALNDTLEQRVLERTAQLDAANRELESFTYSVSHDLRAPLRAIDGFSRIVLEDYSGPLTNEGKVYLQRVRDSTRQMGLLVDNLLVFSRLGRLAILKHSVEPDAIVRNCLAEMTKEQEGRQVEIVIGELPTCQADPTLLAQVWANLLSNALKYTRKQSTARIEIGCRTGSLANGSGVRDRNGSAAQDTVNQVIYFVKDNGTGFDMKYAHKLFGVFQRLHRSADFDGTGVGLAIVQRIVERHGGRIWAEARPNQGATFSFTLG